MSSQDEFLNYKRGIRQVEGQPGERMRSANRSARENAMQGMAVRPEFMARRFRDALEAEGKSFTLETLAAMLGTSEFAAWGSLGASEFDDLTKLRALGEISQRTLWLEAKRRAILAPNFDADEEEGRLAAEGPAPGTEREPEEEPEEPEKEAA